MTATMTASQVLAAATALTLQEQLALNKALCESIRSMQRQKSAIIGAAFRIGQIVRFNAKTRGTKYIKIDKFNRAGTAVVGYECDATGKPTPLKTKWTVGNTVCQAVA